MKYVRKTAALEERGDSPKTSAPVYFLRLHHKDAAEAKRRAKKLGLPMSTWLRMVILERLAREE